MSFTRSSRSTTTRGGTWKLPIGLPSGAYAQDEYGPIVYGRGPLFVTALAEEMGQEAFDEFLRDYFASHKWGIGTGDAFKQLAERHCRCDLTALFQEWVYEIGASSPRAPDQNQ
jgi:aminopeptidase N